MFRPGINAKCHGLGVSACFVKQLYRKWTLADDFRFSLF